MKHVLKALCLLSLCIFTQGHSLEEHFKKPFNKPEISSVEGIDYIYVINLDQRPEKWNATKKQFDTYGITPYRFSAVNGWELTLDQINDIGIKLLPKQVNDVFGTRYTTDETGRIYEFHEKMQNPGATYFSHCFSRGAMGIVLSHLSVLQDAYDSGYQTIWVLEDDAHIIKDPHILTNLLKKLSSLDPNWDVFFTDLDTLANNGKRIPCNGVCFRPNFQFKKAQYYINQRKNITKEIKRVSLRYGAYSMIVSRSGMQKILNFYKNHKIFLPYDCEMACIPNMHIYSAREDLISTTPNSPSDNGGPFYKQKGN